MYVSTLKWTLYLYGQGLRVAEFYWKEKFIGHSLKLVGVWTVLFLLDNLILLKLSIYNLVNTYS